MCTSTEVIKFTKTVTIEMNDVSVYIIAVVEKKCALFGKFIMLLVQYNDSQIWASEYIEINIKNVPDFFQCGSL